MFAALFPHDPQFRGRRVVTFHNQRDFIFFRHHRWVCSQLYVPYIGTSIYFSAHGALSFTSDLLFHITVDYSCTGSSWRCTVYCLFYWHTDLLFATSRYIFKNAKRVGLQEVGPRFTLKLRSLQKGTFDSKFGEYIWIHKVHNYACVTVMYTRLCTCMLSNCMHVQQDEHICSLVHAYVCMYHACYNIQLYSQLIHYTFSLCLAASQDGHQSKEVPLMRAMQARTNPVSLHMSNGCTFNHHIPIIQLTWLCQIMWPTSINFNN